MLYFLPGNQSPDKSLIAKFGLEYAFEDLPLDVGQVVPEPNSFVAVMLLLSFTGMRRKRRNQNY